MIICFDILSLFSEIDNKHIDSLTEATDEDRFKLNDDSEFPPV